MNRTAMIVVMLAAGTGVACSKNASGESSNGAASAAAPVVSVPPAVVETPNLGMTAAAFAKTWNEEVNKTPDAVRWINLDKLAAATPGSTFKVEFVPGLELSIPVSPTGKVERAQLSHAIPPGTDTDALMRGAVLNNLGMSCLFVAANPGVEIDVKVLKGELGGKAGTTTSAVRGNVRFGFSQGQERGAPEIITATPNDAKDPGK